LGVEIPIQKVSTAQKLLIRKCNAAGKPVITATQMLESMVVNPRPTRAEASDVSNAVLDGSDCVMLSSETSKGLYPLEAVRTMAAIATTAEQATDYQQLALQQQQQQQQPLSSPSTASAPGMTVSPILGPLKAASLGPQPPLRTKGESIAASAVHCAHDMRAAAIVVHSDSGAVARFVCKYRPAAPVILLTANKYTHMQARIVRGLWAVLVERQPQLQINTEQRGDSGAATNANAAATAATATGSGSAPVSASVLLATAIAFARARGWLAPAGSPTAAAHPQTLVLVSGNGAGVAGAAHSMRIIDV